MRAAQADGKGVAFPNDFKPVHHAVALHADHGATDAEALEATPVVATVAGRMMAKNSKDRRQAMFMPHRQADCAPDPIYNPSTGAVALHRPVRS